MPDRPPKGQRRPPGASLLDLMANGDEFGSVPPEEVPEPPAGSFGELLARVEEDRAQVRKNLVDAEPYLNGIKAKNEAATEAMAKKAHAIVEVWKSRERRLTFAEAVHRAEKELGLPPFFDDPDGHLARKRGGDALAVIGMKWVRCQGPQKSP